MLEGRDTPHIPQSRSDENGVLENKLVMLQPIFNCAKDTIISFPNDSKETCTGRKGAVIAFTVNEGPKPETHRASENREGPLIWVYLVRCYGG